MNKRFYDIFFIFYIFLICSFSTLIEEYKILRLQIKKLRS